MRLLHTRFRMIAAVTTLMAVLPLEVAGAKPPLGVTFDGRSFAPQLRGEKGMPRESVFVQLGTKWHVRDDGWKLNESGELFDMQDAPFAEQLVPADAPSVAASAARKRLQAVLAQLNPAGGKTEPAPKPKKTPGE